MTTTSVRRQRCEVLFDFEGDIEQRQISVSKGETLVLVKTFDPPRNDWVVVAKPPFGMKGYVPTAYLHIREYRASDKGLSERCGVGFSSRTTDIETAPTTTSVRAPSSSLSPAPTPTPDSVRSVARPSTPSKPLPSPPPFPTARSTVVYPATLTSSQSFSALPSSQTAISSSAASQSFSSISASSPPSSSSSSSSPPHPLLSQPPVEAASSNTSSNNDFDASIGRAPVRSVSAAASFEALRRTGGGALPSSTGTVPPAGIHTSGLVKDSPTCAGCGKAPSTAERIHLFSHTWHKKCCRCERCNIQLTRGSLNVHSLSLKPPITKLYCASCATAVRGATVVTAFAPVGPHESLSQVSSSSSVLLTTSSPIPPSSTSSAPPPDLAAVRSASQSTLRPPGSPPLIIPNKPVPRPPLARAATMFTSHQRGH